MSKYSYFPLSLYNPDTNVANCSAEGYRGDWITSRYHRDDIKDSDVGHLNAVKWIDDNIMQPIHIIAEKRGIKINPT